MSEQDQQFPRAYRVGRRTDFDRAYRQRATASDGLLLVFACRNDLPHPRLGLSVSRKVGGAVVRNRWKRRLREAFRLTRPRLPPGVDLIVIPRASTEPPFESLVESLPRVAARAARKLPRPCP